MFLIKAVDYLKVYLKWLLVPISYVRAALWQRVKQICPCCWFKCVFSLSSVTNLFEFDFDTIRKGEWLKNTFDKIFVYYVYYAVVKYIVMKTHTHQHACMHAYTPPLASTTAVHCFLDFLQLFDAGLIKEVIWDIFTIVCGTIKFRNKTKKYWNKMI